MPMPAFRPADLLIPLVITACLISGAASTLAAVPKPAKSAGPSPFSLGAQQGKAAQSVPASQVHVKEWGPYLDVAFELTYWDRAEIKEWREKRENEMGETLDSFIVAWKGKLIPGNGAAGGGTVYRDRDYLRLAVAQTIDYLQNENRESLNGAAQILDKLKGKGAMPEIAFWTGMVKALQALENNDSPQFVAGIFDIWNNAVMYIEQSASVGSTPASGSETTTFYYRNLVNLVVNRAIIDRKMENLDPLGPLFLMLRERDLEGKDGDGRYAATLVQRIAEGLSSPDSDRCRLNFTVALIEAKRLQQAAAAKLDSEGMSEEAWKTFEKARLFNDYALKWSSSRRSSGVMTAAADYLDMSSFAIQRLADNEKAPAYASFAKLPAQDGPAALSNAMAIFNDIAVYSHGGWEKAGFSSKESYLKATHRLWRAIMELTLWSGEFYLTKLNAAADQQTISSLAPATQVVLDSYLDFLNAQQSRKFADVIPDFAYFGAAEAAEKLAFAYQKMNAYSTDGNAYDQWFLHRLKATEMFPLDPLEIDRTAAVLKGDGRYNLFLDHFLPLAGRFKQSRAVKKWLDEQNSESARPIRDYVAAIDGIFAAAPAGAAEQKGTDSPMLSSARQLREELQRKPDHPVHKLLKEFYLEEMQKTTSYTTLLRESSRQNPAP